MPNKSLERTADAARNVRVVSFSGLGEFLVRERSPAAQLAAVMRHPITELGLLWLQYPLNRSLSDIDTAITI